jgi:iron(III) transport system permease protein
MRSRPAVDGFLILALVPVVLIMVALVTVGFISVRGTEPGSSLLLTGRYYADLYSDRLAFDSFFNTVGYALITLVVALLIGVPAAWLVERTDLPGKRMVFLVMMLGILIPGLFTAMGWLFLLHPRIGLINQWAEGVFALESAPLNVVSVAGMGWISGLGLASLVYIFVAASLRAIDPTLEEAAQVNRAGMLETLRRITLPLLVPSLLATSLYLLMISISSFDIPLVIGLSNRIYLFSTYLYVRLQATSHPPEYGLAAAFSAFMILVAVAASWWYGRMLARSRRYEVITGKAYRPKLIRLGRAVVPAWLFLGGYILLSKVLPLLVVVWTAVLPFLQVPSAEALRTATLGNFADLPWDTVLRGLTNSVVLALVAPTLALFFSLVLSLIVLRSRYRFRGLFDYVAFLPLAIPSIVFGLAALLLAIYVRIGPLDLYGTLLLLIIVYAVVEISFGTRMTNSALIQVHHELDEAGYVSGASRLDVVRRIIRPLVRPARAYGWLWLVLFSFRELTLAVMLSGPRSATLPVAVWIMFNEGHFGIAAASSLLMIAVLILPAVAYWRVAVRQEPLQ